MSKTTDTKPQDAAGLAGDACYAFFYVSKHYDKIEEMRATKHTDKSVWIKGKWSMCPEKVERSAIRSEWGSYFPTRQEALDFLRARLERRIAVAETTITNSRATLSALA